MNNRENDTSWSKVANWYDDYLKDENNYQNKVIWPNLQRLLKIYNGESLTEIGCGNGFFLKKIKEEKAFKKIIGVEISKELLDKMNDNDIRKIHSSAHISVFEKSDIILSVLALQNIEEFKETIENCYKNNNKYFISIINHPAFRVAQHSDWYFDKDRNEQGRVVYNYLSSKKLKIMSNPGKNNKFTLSFHRSMQDTLKIFFNAGYKMVKLEEWTSHKESQIGPKKEIEDKSRREIPMFMCMVFER